MDVLVNVREICLGLPEVSERLSHGEPCWFFKGKRVICMFDDHHHGADRVAVWVPCLPGVAVSLVGDDNLVSGRRTSPPDPLSIKTERGRYFIPPYVGVKGWVGVILDEGTDWDELADLVGVAWGIVGGKRG